MAAGLGGAGEQWGEELREPALHLCALPAAAASLAIRACGVRPDSSPAWELEHGGTTRLGWGAGNTRPPPLASPALAPRTKGELACLLDLFFFFKGLTDLSREPGLPVGFCVWLQEEFFL